MAVVEDEYIIRLFYSDKREEEAFRLLVAKYKEKIYWHVRKMVLGHEDADDIVQNVFLKVWEGMKDFRSDSKLYTWIYRIATNESLNFLSEKRRKVYGNTEELSSFLANTLESDVFFIGDEVQRELQKAILQLSDRQRLVFNMRYFDEMPYDEMSQILNVAVGTLKSTYHVAVKKIEGYVQNVDFTNCLDNGEGKE